MRRFRYVVPISLSLLVSALTLSVLVPARPLTVNEEGEERGETFGGDALRYRTMKLTGRSGRMPRNAYGRAKAQVDRLKWGGAVRRLESAPATPLDSVMFSADSPALPAPSNVSLSPAAWQWLGPGNIGGRIRSLVIKPTDSNTMFAGSVGGGIWKTTNGGASWAPVNDFMAVLSVASLAINPVTPSVIYAGTGEGYYNGDSIRGAGIFKSTDGGTTWSQLASTTGSSFWQVNRLAISPDGRVLLAATRFGLFRSTDAGGSFTQVSGSERGDVDFHPTDSTKAIAAGWGDIVYSVDGGVTWQPAAGVPADAGRIETAYSRNQPNVVYASAERDNGSVYRSGTGGATFSFVFGGGLLGGQGWYDNALWVSPIDANHVIVGGVDLRQSFDGGSSWTNITAYIHTDHHVIVADPKYDGTTNRRVFFGGDGGVNVAEDIATVSVTGFRSLNNNLGVTQFYGGAGNPTTGVIVGGTQDHGTVVRSAAGTSWVQTLGSDGGFAAADPTDPMYFYSETIYLGIYRSSNGGNGWNYIASGIADAGRNTLFIAPFILDPNNPNRMLAGGASLWRTNNVKAATPAWTVIQGSSSEQVSAMAVAPGNSDVVWVGRSYGSVYKSTNGTAAVPAFTALPVPTAGMVTRITIHPFDSNIVYVTTGSFGAANILRTVDGGMTWSAATGSGTTALPEVPVNDLEIDAASPNTVYAATELGVFVSIDGGAHWELPQDGPANVCVDDLFWMGSKLVAATHGRGMFSVETRPAGTLAVSISPSSIDFGTQTVGSTSALRRAIVTNTGTASLTIYGTTIGGANPTDWPGLTSTCTQTIPAGGTCSIDVAFRPGASGARSGEIVLTTNATTSPHSLFLRGSGVVPPPPSSLPSPWVSRDVGATGVAGSASYANGVFTINGAGADIWGTADAFQFAYRTMSGDGSIVARVATVENVQAWTKAGVMIRSVAAAGAASVSLVVTPSRGISFLSRTAAGAATTGVASAGTAPRWMKLVRAGTGITASLSADGNTWTAAGKATLPLGTDVLVGLAVSSHDVTRTARATFDSVAVTPGAAIPSLPAGWTTRDIGAVGQTGSAAEAGGVFTVMGAGADIWGTADAFRFAYLPLPGDGSIVARVTEVQNVNAWTKAGVMIRQTVDATSPHASMLVTPGNGVSFQRRTASGGSTAATTISGTAPRWVRLTRFGQLFTASVSTDGTLWTNVGQATIPMSGTVWAGFAVSSHVTGQTATAKLDRVAVTAAPALGIGWQQADIGAVGLKGSASSFGNTFSVSGSGADIWGTADAFQLAYKALNGDGQLVARVANIENTNRWAKAGVMVRANLTAGAPHAMMAVSAAGGSLFQWRSASGGLAASVSGGTAVVAPQWVKIVRAGNVITGYQSADGIAWTRVGTATMPMGTSAYIGLAVTSHDNTKLARATFEVK